jgi:hypothetical protein
LLNKQIPRVLRAPNATQNLLSNRELENYALVDSSVNLFINGIRNPYIENKIRITINGEIFKELRDEAIEV